MSLAIEPILRWGSDAQKERWLPALAKGERIGCFALSEPASGSDAAAMRTSARRDGGEWVLNGTKNFITNGAIADVCVVFAQTDAAQKHKGIAAFVVEKGTPGFSVGKLERKLGIRALDIYGLSEVIGPGVAMECPESERGMHVLEDHFLPEIIDPETFAPLPPGRFSATICSG